MAAQVHLKDEFMEDEKCHNLMIRLNYQYFTVLYQWKHHSWIHGQPFLIIDFDTRYPANAQWPNHHKYCFKDHSRLMVNHFKPSQSNMYILQTHICFIETIWSSTYRTSHMTCSLQKRRQDVVKTGFISDYWIYMYKALLPLRQYPWNCDLIPSLPSRKSLPRSELIIIFEAVSQKLWLDFLPAIKESFPKVSDYYLWGSNPKTVTWFPPGHQGNLYRGLS